MTTYKQMKQALLSNNTIEFHNPPARVQQMVTILHCAGIVSIVENGTDWRVTLVRKPAVKPNLTVADVEVLTVAPAPKFARVRLADKIRWEDGTRIVTAQWSNKAYPIVGYQHDCLLLDTGYGIIGRRAENVKAA
jgi:hypothetical protein